jgi:hypothetical protein
LGRDLCLVGDEAFLRGWVALIPDPASREAASEEDWVWDVERAAWVRLARDMVKEDLPDAMLALVLHHAGEAGHYPSGLEDAARNSADLQTYEQRIIQENRLFLEETSPAARVRAYDWLKRRGLEPPDWDPLGTKEERTGPLRAWLGTFESGENF